MQTQRAEVDSDGSVSVKMQLDDVVVQSPKPRIDGLLPKDRGLCDAVQSAKICGHFNEDWSKVDTTTWAKIGESLSACPADMKKLQSKLAPKLKSRGPEVSCQSLCNALVKTAKRKYLLPDSSDKACVRFDDNPKSGHCDIDVGWEGIHGIQKEMHPLKDHLMTSDKEDKTTLLQMAEEQYEKQEDCITYHAEELFCQLSHRFRIHIACAKTKVFPSDDTSQNLLETNGTNGISSQGYTVENGWRYCSNTIGSSDWNTKIATAKARAKEWVDYAVMQFEGGLAYVEREAWFSGRRRWGSGSDSTVASRVKTRVKQSLNFVSLKINSANWVQVADRSESSGGELCGCGRSGYNGEYPSGCGAGTGNYINCNAGGTLGYVLKPSISTNAEGATINQGDYWEVDSANWNPRYEQNKCSSSYTSSQWIYNRCVLDSNGDLIVYMCNKWGHFGEASRISTVVHELIHQTGPGDTGGYDHNSIQQDPLATQLDTAENYAALAADVNEIPSRLCIHESEGNSWTPGECECLRGQTKVEANCGQPCYQCRGTGSYASPDHRRRVSSSPPRRRAPSSSPPRRRAAAPPRRRRAPPPRRRAPAPPRRRRASSNFCPDYTSGHPSCDSCPAGKWLDTFSVSGTTYSTCKSSDDHCPDSGSGTSNCNSCACGKTLSSFVQSGNTFYYCESSCTDKYSNCGNFANLCGEARYFSNGMLVSSACCQTCSSTCQYR